MREERWIYTDICIHIYMHCFITEVWMVMVSVQGGPKIYTCEDSVIRRTRQYKLSPGICHQRKWITGDESCVA